MSENWNLPDSDRMRAGVLRPYVRPALLVAFILVCMLWYVTADATSFNSSNIFVPPRVGETTRPEPLPEPGALAVLASGVAAVAVRFVRRRPKK